MSPNVRSISASRPARWPTAYSAVIPMPPCSWIASWPTRRPACPTTTLVRDAVTASPGFSAITMAAKSAVLRASSSSAYMSAARWVSVWNVISGTPNCLRVLRYSVVSCSAPSIAPSASPASATMPRHSASVSTSAARSGPTSSVAGVSDSCTSGPEPSGTCARNSPSPPSVLAGTTTYVAVATEGTGPLVPVSCTSSPVPLAVTSVSSGDQTRPGSARAGSTRASPDSACSSTSEPESALVRT